MITMTDNQFWNLLFAALSDALNIQRLILSNDICLKQRDYKERTGYLSNDIVAHWCLIHYYKLIGKTEIQYRLATVLFALMFAASKCRLKYNDTTERRRKLLNKTWDEMDNDKEIGITWGAQELFEHEPIKLSKTIYNQTVNDCIKAKDRIIEAILSRDEDYIRDYILEI